MTKNNKEKGPGLFKTLLISSISSAAMCCYLYPFMPQIREQILGVQEDIPPATITSYCPEKHSPEQRTIVTTILVPTNSEGKRTYIEVDAKTNYAPVSPTIQTNLPQKSLEEKALERASKQAMEKSLERKVQPIQTPPAKKQNGLHGCTAKTEQKTNSVIEESKHSLKQQESSGKITAYHKKTGAAGYFGYLPKTAMGIVKQAKANGIQVPYNGSLTESAIQKELLTNSEFNEFIATYDLTKRAEIFDNNRGLLAMTHYAGPRDIQKSLKIVYPGRTDYTNVDVREFALARAKGIKIIEKEDGEKKYVKTGKGNSYLLKPQDYGCPSILRYAESVLGKMGYAQDTSINSIPAYVLSENFKPSQYTSSIKKSQKKNSYQQKPKNKHYVSNKHYHLHKKQIYHNK